LSKSKAALEALISLVYSATVAL